MKHVHIAIWLFITIVSFAQCSSSDVEKLRERIRAEHMQQPVNDDRIKNIISTLKDDGTWPDIDYVDTSRIAFQHTVHLNNMISMARAFKKESSSYKGDKNLRQAIELSLDYWIKHDFICENWWNNQIGTPNDILSLLYILDEDLTRERIDKMIKIAYRANMDASGARPSGDRAKIAALLAKNELFQRNEKKFEDALKIVEGEMKFYTSEEFNSFNAEGKQNRNYFDGGRGLQQDYSFHHRADRVNNTNTYGAGFLGAYIEFAELVCDTKYRFSDERTHLAVDFFLDGVCKQMVYGRSTDTGVLNRDISRRGAGSISGASLPESLLKISDYRKEELENIIRARKGEDFTPVSFAKFFWQTEHFAFQRPTFYTSVRMFSTRNRSMEEPYNGEGLTNHYRADGANYLSLDGNEYFDTAPVYDFSKIPGTTIVQVDTIASENQIQKSGKTDFVGGITDGIYGAVAFDFDSPQNNLTARKSWFFFDNFYVCLGANINSTEKYPVATTLNQCLLQGEVLVNDGNIISTMENGNRAIKNAKWVFHNNTGYVFPKTQTVELSNETATGSWYRVNRQTTSQKNEVNEDMFTLWINHGVKPANSAYEYIVMPATNVDGVESYMKNPSVHIFSNTGKMQAVRNGNIGYYIFYEPETITLPGGLKVTPDKPCMLMIQYNGENIKHVTVSDPSRKSEVINFSVNLNFDLSDQNVSTKWDETTKSSIVSIKMPQDDYAGKSVVIEIPY